MRPNQIGRPLLTRLLEAGCWHLFYGFESGSDRVLKLMAKDCKQADNEKAATLHRRMEAPYTASMLMGYPGEREEDILMSIDFIKRHKPPVCGFNWYIPLPGSPDYDRLKAQNQIDRDDPAEWRKIGEIASQAHLFAEVPRERFLELHLRPILLQQLTHDYGVWGCIAPHEPTSAAGARGPAIAGRGLGAESRCDDDRRRAGPVSPDRALSFFVRLACHPTRARAGRVSIGPRIAGLRCLSPNPSKGAMS